jgi:DNA-binding response OmpR family regulator
MATILVADDDRDIRDIVAYKLQRVGHYVILATNGTEALSAARACEPDLVVLDVMMPGMSGIEVCRELRAEPRTAALPVILLTARAQESDVEAGFAVGADDYVVKPFSPSELVSRIHTMLARVRT